MPTRKQLRQIRETEMEFPETRREDDPMYVNPNKGRHFSNHSTMISQETKTDTVKLLEMIIDLRFDLSEYEEKLPKWIWQNFFVQCKDGCHTENQDCAGHLVDVIIDWENGNQFASLEKTINQKFTITEVAF